MSTIPEFTATIPDADLAEGAMQGITVGTEKVLLARVDGEIYAINNVCTHFHTLLSNGELLPDTLQVQCPLHDSCFHLKTGVPHDDPADEPVEVYSTKVEDGMIFIGPGPEA